MSRFCVLMLATLWTILPGSAAGDSSLDAEQWMQRMGMALAKTAYQGVFVYARGSEVSSMQIAHRFRDGMVEERLVLQDGKSGEIVRKGMNVVCVLPEQGRVELNHTLPSGPFTGGFSTRLAPDTDLYRPEILGDDRVAGHDVIRLALNAKDSLRYSHQLWLEKSTGLPVKGKVLSLSGDVLEYFHFTSLTLSDDFPDDAFSIQSKGREISRTLAPQASVEPKSRMKGWELSWKPSGFQPVAAPDPGNSSVAAFSDGLASFSVFVEPANDSDMPSGTSRIGATTVYMQQVEDGGESFLVTVIGEVPLETALKLVESVRIEDAAVLGGNRS